MPDPHPPICFQCGQSATETARLNRFPDGRPCPICAERLLEALPPLLPAYDPSGEPESDPAEVDADLDYDEPA